MTPPSNMKPVARDGELVLYATEDNEFGILYNENDGTQSKQQPLQVFFKWGNFEPMDETDTA